MGEIIDFEANLPHEVCEVVCLACLNRWISVYPESTLLKELQCPYCSNTGFIIKTGQAFQEIVDQGDIK